jgi:hypothetical protein
MGAIARNIANKITTSGVFTSGAITNSSVTGITVLANASDGITFISSQTASSSASISFTGLNSTYKAYKFVFVNIHPSSDEIQFEFQTSTNNGSSYGVTLTTTYIEVYHAESDSGTNLGYQTSKDLAQSTSFQRLFHASGNANDENGSGILTLFNPSSTTYVKHFTMQGVHNATYDAVLNDYQAGYFNTTSAINAIQFKFSAGNIDAGTIYLYGIK